MDPRFYCKFCSRDCKNYANYESHVRGNAHYKEMAKNVPPEFLLQPVPVFMDSDEEEYDDEPRARPLGVRPPQQAAQQQQQLTQPTSSRFKERVRRRPEPQSQ